MGEEHIRVPKDLLHPLVTLHQDEYHVPSGPSLGDSRMVTIDDKVFIHSHNSCLLCAPLTDLSSWSELSLPPDVWHSTLTTYQSQLVLVGGVIKGERTNKVWTSADGHNWHQSLPPMSRCRFWPKAVSSASPECLIVVGGDDVSDRTIEILFSGKWISVPKELSYCHDQITIHNGSLYLYDRSSNVMYCCMIESLLGEDHEKYWKTIPLPILPLSHRYNSFVVLSFEQHLLAVCKESTYVYSPGAQSWVFMDNSLLTEDARCAVTFKDHIIVKTAKHLYHLKTTAVSAYDPDSQFSKGGLCRLEAAGIPVMTSLEKVGKKVAAAIGVHYNPYFNVNILEEWASMEMTSTRPPTWRTLYEVLRELDLEELSQEIEEYLSCPRSLKEQCTSAIVSVLLQQRSLEPDQLHVRLPDYVPPRVKRSITDVFRAHTLQPPPPSLSPPPSKIPRVDE